MVEKTWSYDELYTSALFNRCTNVFGACMYRAHAFLVVHVGVVCYAMQVTVRDQPACVLMHACVCEHLCVPACVLCCAVHSLRARERFSVLAA